MDYQEIAVKSIIQGGRSVNLYWGCTHNCIYCDARSECYNKPNFETIKVKKDCIKIFTEELYRKRNKVIVSTGSMCDPYIPLEEKLGLTRQMLEVILKRKFGVSLLTKNTLILRDLELIKKINEECRAIVCMTVTAASDSLCKLVEPDVSLSSERFSALKKFKEKNVITGIWMTPILPFIADTPENIKGIVQKAYEANVDFIVSYGFGTTKRKGSEEYFYQKLDEKFPGIKEKYIRAYGKQYICSSPREEELYKIFVKECEKYNIVYKGREIGKRFYNIEKYQQLSIFD